MRIAVLGGGSGAFAAAGDPTRPRQGRAPVPAQFPGAVRQEQPRANRHAPRGIET